MDDDRTGLVVAAIALLVAVIVVVGARSFLADDDGDEVATAATTTVGTTATSATAPTTTRPTTVAPTLAPSTTTTTPVPSGPLADGQTCTLASAGAVMTYPAGWVTASEPDWSCALFDPDPIEVLPQTELPVVGAQVALEPIDLADAVDQRRTPFFGTVLDEEAVDLPGGTGTCLEVEDTGNGLMPAGTLHFACLQPWAGGTLVVATTGVVLEGEGLDPGYGAAVEVVRAMAAAVEPTAA